MRLFEFFDEERDQATKIGIVINQLEQDLDSNEINWEDYTVDELLQRFDDNEVQLDPEDLYTMIKVPPLKDLIKNIKGKKIEFVGYSEEEALAAPEDKQDEIVAKMAKSAMK